MSKGIIFPALVFFLQMYAQSSYADQVTYNYTGNTFQYITAGTEFKLTDSIVGSFTSDRTTNGYYWYSATDHAQPNTPNLTFSFTYTKDGVPTTVTNADASANDFFDIYVNPLSGLVEGWVISAYCTDTTPGLGCQVTTNNNPIFDVSDDVCITNPNGTCSSSAANLRDPGTWSGPLAAVPEPNSCAMLIAGLGLLGFVTRSRKDQAAEFKDKALSEYRADESGKRTGNRD